MLYVSPESKAALIEDSGWKNFPVATEGDVVNFVLRESYNIIKNKKYWCQNTMARNQYGNSVDPDDDSAKSWCSMGILFNVNKRYKFDVFSKTIQWLTNHVKWPSLHHLNDNNTHEYVISVWENAIKGENGG